MFKDPPLSYTEMESGKLVGKGVAFNLLEFLMKKYNFTYEIVQHEKNIIGSREDFEGSLLESLHKNVNFLISPFLYRKTPFKKK